MSDLTGIWKLEDQEYYKNSGLFPIKKGSYKISFGEVDGYYTPEDITLQLNDAGTLVVNYYKKPTYTLTIETYKRYINNNDVKFSGYWRFVGDTEWKFAGSNIELEMGSYNIEFKDENGFITPSSIAVKMKDNITIQGIYKLDVSILFVTLTADEFVYPFHGTWKIQDQTNWLETGGHTELQKNTDYIILFNSNEYYSPPDSQTINISDNNNKVYTFYTKYFTLTMNLNVGRWKVSTETEWKNSGESIILSREQTYTIEFEDFAGYETPANYTVLLDSSKTINLTYLISTTTFYKENLKYFESGGWNTTGKFVLSLSPNIEPGKTIMKAVMHFTPYLHVQQRTGVAYFKIYDTIVPFTLFNFSFNDGLSENETVNGTSEYIYRIDLGTAPGYYPGDIDITQYVQELVFRNDWTTLSCIYFGAGFYTTDGQIMPVWEWFKDGLISIEIKTV